MYKSMPSLISILEKTWETLKAKHPGLAQALQGVPGVWALAADTDGIDGVEDNAGAFVTPDTLAQAAEKNMKLADYLDRNDAYGYFDALDALFVTGPTHTNVNDFRAVLVL